MITGMKKVIFLGLKEEKKCFIKTLQEIGITHVDLPKDINLPSEIGREIQKVSEIRKFLVRAAEKAGQTTVNSNYEYTWICAEQEKLVQKETTLASEISILKKERTLLEPWGEFDPQDISDLKTKGVTVQCFKASRTVFGKLDLDHVIYSVIMETPGEIAFAVFTTTPLNLEIAEERLPAKRLSDIEALIRTKESELAEIKTAYRQLSAQVPVLMEAEARLTDEFEYQKTVLNTASELEDRLFTLTCWSPVEAGQLVKMVHDKTPGMTFVHFDHDPEPGDRVPVLMQNKTPFDSGEDLVKVYSHPNYADFDPSALVLACFVIFYGMIIGDAGYGLVFLLFTLYLHFKVKSQSTAWLRFRRLSYFLAGSVIFFGLITASYFGIKIPAGSFVNKLQLLSFGSKEGQNFVMLITIIIGMAHLSLALGIKFIRARDIPSLGWIVITWSGFVYIYSNGNNAIAKWVLIGGFGIIILFTSSHRNIIIRLLLGLNGALGAVQLFADILSYLRLFALGLATMYMCQTFNMLAHMAYTGISSHPWIGIIPGLLILVAGHSINIVLGIMGGVVHGLRLNFLEWYRWCFEGDGLPFKPFRRIWKENVPPQ